LAAIERALPIEAVKLRPDRKEDLMSSEISTSHLETEDLTMLQGILVSCGYTGNISVHSDGHMNAAAKLLIKLFREGVKDPAQLANALHRNFDMTDTGSKILPFSGLHRYAVYGVTPQGRRVH